jgi:hypothetical protein
LLLILGDPPFAAALAALQHLGASLRATAACLSRLAALAIA